MLEIICMFALWGCACLIIGYRIGRRIGITIAADYTTRHMLKLFSKVVPNKEIAKLLYNDILADSFNILSKQEVEQLKREYNRYIDG